MRSEVVRLDVSIGVSLLDRAEQERVQGKLERQHPYIPNAATTPSVASIIKANTVKLKEPASKPKAQHPHPPAPPLVSEPVDPQPEKQHSKPSLDHSSQQQNTTSSDGDALLNDLEREHRVL